MGTALIETVLAETGCRRLWLITTNDNTDALRFYQRRGFRLAELHPGAVDRSRATLKPEIPVIGDHGIPIRDPEGSLFGKRIVLPLILMVVFFIMDVLLRGRRIGARRQRSGDQRPGENSAAEPRPRRVDQRPRHLLLHLNNPRPAR